MHRMVTISILLFIGAISMSFGQMDPKEREALDLITNFTAAFRQAVLDNNTQLIGEMLSDDFEFNDCGRKMGKAKIIPLIAAMPKVFRGVHINHGLEKFISENIIRFYVGIRDFADSYAGYSTVRVEKNRPPGFKVLTVETYFC